MGSYFLDPLKSQSYNLMHSSIHVLKSTLFIMTLKYNRTSFPAPGERFLSTPPANCCQVLCLLYPWLPSILAIHSQLLTHPPHASLRKVATRDLPHIPDRKSIHFLCNPTHTKALILLSSLFCALDSIPSCLFKNFSPSVMPPPSHLPITTFFLSSGVIPSACSCSPLVSFKNPFLNPSLPPVTALVFYSSSQ